MKQIVELVFENDESYEDVLSKNGGSEEKMQVYALVTGQLLAGMFDKIMKGSGDSGSISCQNSYFVKEN